MRLLSRPHAPLAAALALVAAPALPAQGAPGPARDLVALRLEPLASFLGHPKDQGLLRTLRLLEARLAELPAEVPDLQPVDPAWLELAAEVLGAAKSLRLGLREGAPLDGGELPFYGALRVHCADGAGAAALETQLLEVLRALGAPELERRADGLFALPGPQPPVGFGASGADVVLDVAAPAGPMPALGDPLLPGDGAPDLALALDLGPLSRVLLAQLEREEPQAAALVGGVVSKLGLTDLRLGLACAVHGGRSQRVLRVPGYGATLRRLGAAPQQTLQPDDFAPVPLDATWASVGRANFGGLLEALLDLAREALAAQGVDGDPAEMLAGLTGFDLRADFVDVLGEAYGMYASDTTGGGGLTSTVAYCALRDAERALETRERLEELLNGLATMQAQGYVQVRGWSDGGAEYATLMFPGLPVPLEPTVAISERWLFVAASRGAAVEAVRQATSDGAPSLLAHPALASELGGGLGGALSVSFEDCARLLRDGYGAMQMVGSALANGVRSRADGMREPGLVLPPYHELARGVAPSVTVARLAGDDYVSVTRGDASLAVQLTAFCGWCQSNGLLLALPLLGVVSQQQAQPAVTLEVRDY